jgi:hypothetical protein
MQKFLRRSSQGNQYKEDESSSDLDADDANDDDDDEENADDFDDDDDDDDDLVTTVTRSVGTLSHSHNELDEDEFLDGNMMMNTAVVEAYGSSCESLDLQNESTFHDDSDDDMVNSIEMPFQYKVNDSNNGSKDSMGY